MKLHVFICAILNIDCSELLVQLLPTWYRFNINTIKYSISSITLPDWILNNYRYKVFDFSRFAMLRFLSIGDDSFGNVNTFKIDGLKLLCRLKIGKNSFTQVKGDPQYFYYNESKSFHILNCESLESIEIGEYSFSDFAGEFELKNLPQLQSIQIGTIGSKSSNFCYSSFMIRGIDTAIKHG